LDASGRLTLSPGRFGEEVGLSAAAVQRRLKRLRAHGVIAAETAVLDKSLDWSA